MNYDLIVVGGGILGTFHAYWALEQGKKVLLTERDERPSMATIRNFGQVIPSGMSRGIWHEFGRKTLQTYKEIQAQTNIGIRQNGATYFASCPEDFQVLCETHEYYQSIDYPCQLLTPELAKLRFPHLKDGYNFGALHFPEEVTAEPRTMIYRIIEFMQQKYEHFHYRPNTPIIELETIGDRCQATDSWGNTFSADFAIVCSGADFRTLYPKVYAESDLMVCKLHMMSTYPQQKTVLHGSILTGHSIRRYGVFKDSPSFKDLPPIQDELSNKFEYNILFKQAIDGSVILGDSHEYVPAHQAERLSIDSDETIIQGMVDECKKVMDLDDWRIQYRWNGYYAESASKSIFIEDIDERIQVVNGIGGKGMTTACGFAHHNIEKRWKNLPEETDSICN